jgi:hypothetical protein
MNDDHGIWIAILFLVLVCMGMMLLLVPSLALPTDPQPACIPANPTCEFPEVTP